MSVVFFPSVNHLAFPFGCLHLNPSPFIVWFYGLIIKFPNYKFPQIQYEIKTEYSTTFGDILPMLGIEESPSTKPKLIPQGMMQEDLYKYIKNDDVNGVHTKGADETAPRALVFRDSFFSALEPFVSPLFSETEYIWKRFEESDKEYILEYKPDIIIFECVERYFPDICYNVK